MSADKVQAIMGHEARNFDLNQNIQPGVRRTERLNSENMPAIISALTFEVDTALLAPSVFDGRRSVLRSHLA